ncbi:COMM domain-containing protein 3 [Acropora cervicornis]|uniref:COMM domain-containing protein 3 n=1 Tax=Acropora cervicornis TaxID=6130 RepID=A0AAD9QIR8_ACRCE|nr:COMM domain-containing protein 3 [Acropora cervicornis]
MELSSVAIEGVGLCGDSTRVGDRAFRSLVQLTLDILLKKKSDDCLANDEDIISVDNASLKQGYAGLVSLILEAVKMDSDLSTISSMLEDCKWATDRIEYFFKCFQDCKPEMEALLSRFDLFAVLLLKLTPEIRCLDSLPLRDYRKRSCGKLSYLFCIYIYIRTGSSFPHIVDVDWRLDYYIKNNQMEKVNKPMYLITLKTEESGKPQGKDVQFSCSMEQLQDLVGKLKDACKSIERAAVN